jgi:hypothetical protein
VSGEEAEPAAILRDLSSRGARQFVSPALSAQVHLARGENETAIDLLEQAAALRDPEVVHLSNRAVYSRLTGDPRFERLRTLVGLPGGTKRSTS